MFAPVPGFVGQYEVGNRGTVRSLTYVRKGEVHAYVKPREMRTFIRHGYVRVTLSVRGVPSNRKGGRYNVGVHRLVALAFIDPFPDEGLEVAHLDGNQLNNCVWNLAWVTHAENIAHQREHGTFREGDAHHRSLDVDTCERVLRLRQAGTPYSAIAERLGISASAACRIGQGGTANARLAHARMLDDGLPL